MGFASRLLGMLGLDFDFSVDMRSEPFSRITEGLFVGSRPGPDDVTRLRRAGITHVFSCLEEDELQSVAFLSSEFDAHGWALRDGMDQDIAAAFPTFFAFAKRVDAHRDGRLLVHCQAGVSRSATLATALLMRAESNTFLEAFRQLRSKRPGVLPNIGFASQLQRLERELGVPTTEPCSLALYLREICQAPVEVELIQEILVDNDYDAPRALRAIFGGEIPRVVQGARF